MGHAPIDAYDNSIEGVNGFDKMRPRQGSVSSLWGSCENLTKPITANSEQSAENYALAA